MTNPKGDIHGTQIDQLLSCPDEQCLLVLARLTYFLTLAARGSYVEAGTEPDEAD